MYIYTHIYSQCLCLFLQKNLSITFLQQIISDELLPAVITGQKNNFNGGFKIKSSK